MDAMKLKTFYQLLDEGYTPAQLAGAVETHGVTGWDRYGRYASFKPKSPGASEALDSLAEFFAQLERWKNQGIDQPYGPLDVAAEMDESQLHHFGWEEGQLPGIDRTLQYPALPKPKPKSEIRDKSYLNVIGVMLGLLIRRRGADDRSQSAVIDDMVAVADGAFGISKSNLEKIFSAANKSLSETPPR